MCYIWMNMNILINTKAFLFQSCLLVCPFAYGNNTKTQITLCLAKCLFLIVCILFLIVFCFFLSLLFLWSVYKIKQDNSAWGQNVKAFRSLFQRSLITKCVVCKLKWKLCMWNFGFKINKIKGFLFNKRTCNKNHRRTNIRSLEF